MLIVLHKPAAADRHPQQGHRFMRESAEDGLSHVWRSFTDWTDGQNAARALQFIRDSGVKLTNIGEISRSMAT